MPATNRADSVIVADRMGTGLSGAVATMAWLKPDDAARVPCNISVHPAIASILPTETDPEV
jgi:hypothetical protein